ncbi:hypothetical protein X777_07170 [Ooceraea biroi]|uniref:Uncharacterized protein n=1 Tax=Ooceraea biroi TaxID=2015173 RepID=A0A026WAI4_OOCBI|nr:hypothetical protein X777_07170 [Ooceraea biroi]
MVGCVLTATYCIGFFVYIGDGMGDHANAHTGPPTKNVGTAATILSMTARYNKDMIKTFYSYLKFLVLFRNLYHTSEELINFVFSVSKITTFNVMIECESICTLNGHKKLLAYLNFGPTVNISWIKSSVQMMLDRPKYKFL